MSKNARYLRPSNNRKKIPFNIKVSRGFSPICKDRYCLTSWRLFFIFEDSGSCRIFIDCSGNVYQPGTKIRIDRKTLWELITEDLKDWGFEGLWTLMRCSTASWKKTRSMPWPRIMSLYWLRNMDSRSWSASSDGTGSYILGNSMSASSTSSPVHQRCHSENLKRVKFRSFDHPAGSEFNPGWVAKHLVKDTVAVYRWVRARPAWNRRSSECFPPSRCTRPRDTFSHDRWAPFRTSPCLPERWT